MDTNQDLSNLSVAELRALEAEVETQTVALWQQTKAVSRLIVRLQQFRYRINRARLALGDKNERRAPCPAEFIGPIPPPPPTGATPPARIRPRHRSRS